MTSATEQQTAAVLAEVNASLGTTWRLLGRLSGGYQGGAWIVEIGKQRRAVFKWSAWPAWAPRVRGANAVVDFARGHGYPTPAWLAVGTTSAGYPFHIEDVVYGFPLRPLTGQSAELLVDLVDLQRRISPSTEVDWADYIRAAVFDGDSWEMGIIGTAGGPALKAVDTARRLAAAYRGEHITDDQLVHGDLSLGNVLGADGQITGVVDIEAVGCGPAVMDLFRAIRELRLDDTPGPVEVLEQAVFMWARPAEIAVCAAAELLGILAFGIRNWPDAVPDVSRRAELWLELLAGQLASASAD